MKKELKGLFTGVIIGSLITSGIVFAKTGVETIQASYQNIKLYVDGIKIDPKDATGKSVEPFIYNGTTYLPVRAVGEAFSKQVSWDGETKSVYVGEKPGDVQHLVNVCPPYNSTKCTLYNSRDGKSLSIGGKKYTNGMKLHYKGGFALINLDGKYNYLSCVIGRPDEDNIMDTTVNFFVDDVLVESIAVKGDALPNSYTIPLKKGLQLKIATDYEDVGIMDIILK